MDGCMSVSVLSERVLTSATATAAPSAAAGAGSAAMSAGKTDAAVAADNSCLLLLMVLLSIASPAHVQLTLLIIQNITQCCLLAAPSSLVCVCHGSTGDVGELGVTTGRGTDLLMCMQLRAAAMQPTC